jgi:hypothetical protein
MKSVFFDFRKEIKATAEALRAPRPDEKSKRVIGLAYLFPLRIISGFLGVFLGALGVLAVASSDDTTTPFYYASSTPMDVQARMLIIGVNDHIGQAIVSQDRKYVTLNMDAGLLGNAGIQKFNYQRGGLGFVGSEPKQVVKGAGNGLTPTIPNSAGEISPPVSVLDKPGMVLIASLER